MLTRNLIRTVISDGPLAKRGVSAVELKPLNVRKADRADGIVRQAAFDDLDDAMLEKMDKVRSRAAAETPKETKKPTRDEQVSGYRAAFEYICYSGIKTVEGEAVPDPPEGMLTNGKSDEEGWLDDFSFAETRQLADIVLDESGMVEETPEAQGNA